MKRVVFLGQKPVGEKAFAMLLGAECKALRVVAVCSNPTADNVWWNSNEIALSSNELPFLSNEKKDEGKLLKAIERSGANLLISVHHPYILSETVLKTVDYQAFNVHNAKIPDYRGWNAVNHALLNGDSTFTSTVHWMVREVDMGSIAFERTIPIGEDEIAQSLYIRAGQAALKAFERLLHFLVSGKDIPRKPVLSKGRFYGRDSIEGLREIRDLCDDQEVDRKSRAFYFPPFEPAYFMRASKKFYVLPSGAEMNRLPNVKW